MSIQTAIIGASGYTGAELLRLLALHPEFNVAAATGDTQAGKGIAELYPHLARYQDLRFEEPANAAEKIAECELVFAALPHGEAMSILPALHNRTIIDLGSDFRLANLEDYRTWYGSEHKSPSELGSWAYGLPELFRSEIREARRIANPGCYATASILASLPLAENSLVDGALALHALSGLSGGGRPPKPAFHLPHAYEDIRSYKIGLHQHTPEIEMALSKKTGRAVQISLTTSLAPMSRGIHLICSGQLNRKIDETEIRRLYQQQYAGEKFIRIVSEQPGTKDVRGSNFVFICPSIDKRLNRVVVTAVLDNLVKGAAGQAIQNANLALNLVEDAGLEQLPLYP